MTNKKIGSEKRFEYNGFKIKIGSIDKKETRVFFVEYAGKIDSSSNILSGDFCKTIKDWFMKNNFYDFTVKGKTIIDVDYPEKYNDNLTYVNFKTFNCLSSPSKFSDIAPDIENIINSSIMPELLKIMA